MYYGKLVESAFNEGIFIFPQHPYTQCLLWAVPKIDPSAREKGIELAGEVPSDSNSSPGCKFYSRCPKKSYM